MWSGETVEPTIRNQRCDRWRAIIVRTVLAVGWVAGLIFLATSNMQPFRQVGFVALALVLGAFSLLIVLSLPWANPVARLKLGDDLEVNPGWRRYKPERIKQIEFARDPAEDYHDYAALPVPMCEVRIRHDCRVTFRLIVSESDAERLRTWAAAKGIAVCNADGYQPRTAEPASGA